MSINAGTQLFLLSNAIQGISAGRAAEVLSDTISGFGYVV